MNPGRWVFAAGMVWLGATCGCSEQKPARIASVHGTVKVGGAPLPGGRLTFRSLEPNHPLPVSAAIIRPDGTFVCTDTPVGPVAAAVDTEYVKTDLQAGGSDSQPSAFKYVMIPKKYADPDSSGLTFDVQRGDQEFNIDLAP